MKNIGGFFSLNSKIDYFCPEITKPMDRSTQQIVAYFIREESATIPEIAARLGVSIGTATKEIGRLLE